MFHSKTYTVRRGGGACSLEVSLPMQLRRDGVLKEGDKVELLWDTFVVVCPPNQRLDAKRLAVAIELARIEESEESNETKTKETAC